MGCTIVANELAGVSVSSGGKASLVKCTSHRSKSGAGVAVTGDNSYVEATCCTFEGSELGGVLVRGGGNANLHGCTARGADSAYGVYVDGADSAVTAADSTVQEGCHVKGFGQATFKRCVFRNVLAGDRPAHTSSCSTPSLLLLPDDLLWRVLAAASFAPLHDPALQRVCKRFIRVLCKHANTLTLKGAEPSPALIALLMCADAARHVDITKCDDDWPLTHVLPHLPSVESLEMGPVQAFVRLLPTSLSRVCVTRVHVSSQAEVDVVARLHERLEGGTVVVRELYNHSVSDLPCEGLRSGGAGSAPPLLVTNATLHFKDLLVCDWSRLASLTELRLTFLGPSLNGIACLPHLRALRLSHCPCLTELSLASCMFTALTCLELVDCEDFETLPAELGRLRHVEELKLERLPKLSTLPPEVAQLVALKLLRIDECGLQELPATIGDLVSLMHLEVGRGEAWLHLPTELGSLTSLKALQASLARMTTCPTCIANLSALTSLVLRHCDSITSIPQEMGQLSELQHLEISCTSSGLTAGRALDTLPDAVGALTSLTNLNLTACFGLRALPGSIGNLSALVQLTLTMCRSVTALPDTLCALASLQGLHLYGCVALATLPESIGDLPALRTLDLEECCALTALPASLARLSPLTLTITDCTSLSTLPAELSGMRSLSLVVEAHERLPQPLLECLTSLCASGVVAHLDLGMRGESGGDMRTGTGLCIASPETGGCPGCALCDLFWAQKATA